MQLERALAIPGFTSETKLLWLARQAADRPVIVEIGSWLGRSTRALADNCPGVVFAVDDWRGPEDFPENALDPDAAYAEFCKNVGDLTETGKVVPIRVASPAAASVFPAGIDMLFVDGLHTLEAVRTDLRAWLPLLTPEALLCGDDFSDAWPGVVGAVNERLQSFDLVPGTDLWFTRRPAAPVAAAPPAGTSLYLATPAYGRKVDTDFALSLTATALLLARRKIAATMQFVPNDSLITRARSGLASDFLLRSDCSHLVFVDGDLGWRANDLLRLVSCAAGHDVVLGVYPKKERPVQWPMNFLGDAPERVRVCAGCGAMEIQDGPAGFMAIQRSALERMAQAHPELECEVARHVRGWAFFNSEVHGGDLRGEDFGFCRLLRACGGRVWMLPDIPFVHGGFHGCFDTWLREEHGLSQGRQEEMTCRA